MKLRPIEASLQVANRTKIATERVRGVMTSDGDWLLLDWR
jgi:hypothetical protein